MKHPLLNLLTNFIKSSKKFPSLSYFVFLPLLFFISCSTQLEKTDKSESIFLADFKISDNLPNLSYNKGEAAFTLAVDLTNGRLRNIDLKVKDSLAQLTNKNGSRVTAFTVAKILESDKIAFLNVNRLANILRVDATFMGVDEDLKKEFGKGYSLIRYREQKTDKQIYDVALLEAVQKAIANALGDSLLYSSAGGSFQVFPTKTIAIGGIDFQESDQIVNDKSIKKWDLFRNKEVSSFDAVESIFEELYKSKKFVAYDIASRDSMFAYFGIYGVDNCHLPSIDEITILRDMDIDYYIFGAIVRNEEGASITLSLNQVGDNQLTTIKSAKGEIAEDNILDLRKVVKELIHKLIDI